MFRQSLILFLVFHRGDHSVRLGFNIETIIARNIWIVKSSLTFGRLQLMNVIQRSRPPITLSHVTESLLLCFFYVPPPSIIKVTFTGPQPSQPERWITGSKQRDKTLPAMNMTAIKIKEALLLSLPRRSNFLLSGLALRTTLVLMAIVLLMFRSSISYSIFAD